jgi:uncharacterized protein
MTKLNKLSLKDRSMFCEYLGLDRHELSVYSFENIYIWKKLYDIKWEIIDNNLCVFFMDKIGAFLYLAPLGRKKSQLAINSAFAIMDRYNKNKDLSRIENIEEKEAQFFLDSGYLCKIKSHDYLCLRSSLAGLRGDKFKAKRACFNYFVKHCDFEYLPFSAKDIGGCLGLYSSWVMQRSQQNQDHVYLGMMDDSLNCLKLLLKDCGDLDITARIVKIDDEIKAFTFGYRLNNDTFCILYEITDLTIKGLAQFIFRRFSEELKDYKYINIMDDSGLENLKKVKISYHPIRLLPGYIARRKEYA